MRTFVGVVLLGVGGACAGQRSPASSGPEAGGSPPPIICVSACDAGSASAASPVDAARAPEARAREDGSAMTCLAPPECVCTASGDCEEALPVPTAMHREGDIDYLDPPPAGGPHNGCWGAFGVHKTPLPAERFVHNLEHGAVALLYYCPVPASWPRSRRSLRSERSRC